MGDCLACGWGIVFYSSANNKMDLLHNKKEIVMAHLIDKDAVVAEIEKRRNDYINSLMTEQVHTLSDILDFIGTLEVKEMDLDESARHYLLHEHVSPLNEVLHQSDIKAEMQYHKDIENAFKMGFELGIKAQKGE